ncbi:fibronectin type III domain-containing protein [Geomonas terrae]|uniref:Fibronectin type III domain-containing protein n=2 Tax=Geomonas terrae TaxID=2562681 RepID=A0A4S1CEA9_9BACT|nr:fibronectin type III domain-containing protein [Geomonas terrae]
MPDLEKIQQAHERHRSIFSEVLGGASEKEEELASARNYALNIINLLHGVALLTGKYDSNIPQKLDLVQQQPITKLGANAGLGATENFRLVYEGQIIVARGSAVKGAKSYEIWICEGDPLTESNWRHHITSGCVNRIEMTDLTPGRLYYFRIRAVSSHATGPWSNFISMMAI